MFKRFVSSHSSELRCADDERQHFSLSVYFYLISKNTFKDESSGRSLIDALLSLNHRKVDPQKYSKLTEYNVKFNNDFWFVCFEPVQTPLESMEVLVMRGGNSRSRTDWSVNATHKQGRGLSGLLAAGEGWRVVGNDCCQCEILDDLYKSWRRTSSELNSHHFCLESGLSAAI